MLVDVLVDVLVETLVESVADVLVDVEVGVWEEAGMVVLDWLANTVDWPTF